MNGRHSATAMAARCALAISADGGLIFERTRDRDLRAPNPNEV